MLQNTWVNLIKNLHYISQRSVILAFNMIDRDWHWGLVGIQVRLWPFAEPPSHLRRPDLI